MERCDNAKRWGRVSPIYALGLLRMKKAAPKGGLV